MITGILLIRYNPPDTEQPSRTFCHVKMYNGICPEGEQEISVKILYVGKMKYLTGGI